MVMVEGAIIIIMSIILLFFKTLTDARYIIAACAKSLFVCCVSKGGEKLPRPKLNASQDCIWAIGSRIKSKLNSPTDERQPMRLVRVENEFSF